MSFAARRKAVERLAVERELAAEKSKVNRAYYERKGEDIRRRRRARYLEEKMLKRGEWVQLHLPGIDPRGPRC